MRAFMIVGVGVMTAAASFGSAASAGDAAQAREARTWSVGQAACGTPGKPPCPLQAWMRANVAAPLAANNGEALAEGLAKIAKLQPDPTWTSWSQFAKSGADAARKGNLPGARAACRGCHDTWREAYKARFRMQPIPR